MRVTDLEASVGKSGGALYAGGHCFYSPLVHPLSMDGNKGRPGLRPPLNGKRIYTPLKVRLRERARARKVVW